VCGLLGLLPACGGDDEQRSLDPVQVGMTADLEPAYDDGELTLFEVKRAIQFPIVAPSAADLEAAAGRAVAPFARYPFVTNRDVEVQVSWTLTNLDEGTHNVALLIEPWNEFGRYVPGLALVDAEDAEFAPNLSGIEILMDVPGTADSRSSRAFGVFTIEDMNELAIDFAVAMNVIANPPSGEDGPSATTLVNHSFAVEQRSHRDVLSRPYIPGVIPGLTGIDVGLRTYEAANVALEVVVEVIDKGNGKVLAEDSSDTPMAVPAEEISIAYEAPM
jgi:hypothetical protein